MDEAVASKDFANAGKLHEEIDMLERKVESRNSQVGRRRIIMANKRGYASLVILSEIGIGIGDDVYVSRVATTTTNATYIL